MLSKTADRKPRPKAVCQDAAGSCSTGIIEAASTSDSRNTLPRTDSGTCCQSGRRIGAVSRIVAADRDADEREAVGERRRISGSPSGWSTTAAPRISATTPMRGQSSATRARHPSMIGEWRCCCSEAGTREDQEGGRRGDVGVQHVDGAHAVEPHHRGRGVADHAAGAAGIGGGDDRGQVADVHPLAEHGGARRCRRSSRPRCCRGSSTARTPGPATPGRPSSHRAAVRQQLPARGQLEVARQQRRSRAAGRTGW